MIWSAVIARILPSFTLRVYGQNLARLAFHGNAKWPATDLAIPRELLVPHRRIHHDAVLLPAVRAHQFFSVLHYSLFFRISNRRNASSINTYGWRWFVSRSLRKASGRSKSPLIEANSRTPIVPIV